MYDLYQMQINLDRLIQVAKKEMPDAVGFTTIITYWDDDTYQIDYRHSNECIHRFVFESKEPNYISYFEDVVDTLIAIEPVPSYNLVKRISL